MDRLTFIKKVTGAMLVGIPLYSIMSCSDSESDPLPMTDPNCLLNGTVSHVSSNHGHSIFVTKADVSAGVDKQYDIKGSSIHSHIVTVSASDFALLESNQQIQITSTSGDSHVHLVTISCA